MMHSDLSQKIIEAPISNHHSIFLEGVVGTGKSQILIDRLRYLLKSGVTGYSILVLVPERGIGERYKAQIQSLDLGAFGRVEIQTYYGLATRLVRTFWPLVASAAGYQSPSKPPVMLTFETAQYVMDRIVTPRLEQGYFEGLSLRSQRIVSQLIDNLNKAAVNGYGIDQVEDRLRKAWTGKDDRLRHYQHGQNCIQAFRSYCLERGLLDLSLTVEVFHQHLVKNSFFWQYFTGRYRHLLVDNLEESVPVAQDLIKQLIPICDSTMLAYDLDGGYRVFLGIDADHARELSDHCQETIHLKESRTSSADMAAFSAAVGEHLRQFVIPPETGHAKKAIIKLIQETYRAKMIEEVGREIADLVRKGISPGDIAVVAPYADGVLRFTLREEFKKQNIPFRVVRRYESLKEEPIVRACLTLAALAHPQWEIEQHPFPHPFDLVEALTQTIDQLDFVRAQLIVKFLYDENTRQLKPANAFSKPERIGFARLERYDAFRVWIENYQQQKKPDPIDHFIRRLFGELISGPDLDPHAAFVCARLVASAEWFREVAPAMEIKGDAVGEHYLRMIYKEIITAQYLSDQAVGMDAVTLVAPVYTYLLSGHTAKYQFWLDVGSMSWWEPPHQPLTNPHVLARQWMPDQLWTDAIDFEKRQESLYKMVAGLTQRCTTGIYICGSDLEITGEPQDSPLLRAVQRIIRTK